MSTHTNGWEGKMGRLVFLTISLVMSYQSPATAEEPLLSEGAAKIMA